MSSGNQSLSDDIEYFCQKCIVRSNTDRIKNHPKHKHYSFSSKVGKRTLNNWQV